MQVQPRNGAWRTLGLAVRARMKESGVNNVQEFVVQRRFSRTIKRYVYTETFVMCLANLFLLILEVNT